MYTGAYWGLGHGIGAMLVGALGYAVKGWLNLDALAQWGEVAVGLSILIIGILGLQETSQWRDGDPDVPPGMAAASAIASGEAISVAPPSHTSSLLTGAHASALCARARSRRAHRGADAACAPTPPQV